MLSIIIVNYNAGRLLKECIDSIYKESVATSFDVWVVDNSSQDDSIAMVKEYFPEVKVIENRSNLGFSRANNIVISRTNSDCILLLNPDTVVIDHAIEKMVQFMIDHPKTGLCGCKVLNQDGTLQRASRRSIPTPGIAFFRLTGLSRLFPKSKIMAKYNLTYLDPNETHEVDAVSGACMMIKRKVIDDIGMLDERFFMYGEDLDLCLRAKKAGWAVMYYPGAEIVHHKGKCSKSNSRKATLEFYRAMWLFHNKHFADHYSPITNFFIYTGIFLKAFGAWKSFLFSGRVGSKG